jgi:predicted dinucleotide-binding enzyme
VKVAILGSGNVGSALGAGWLRAGHQVTFGVRDEGSNARQVARELGAAAAPLARAVEAADAVVLAVPWPAVAETLAAAGNLHNKVLLDCTNPLLPDLAGLELGLTDSGAERVAAWSKGARVVKIFNTTGANNMLEPRIGASAITMLYAGNDAEAKQVAAHLARDLGFAPLDAGPLTAARMLEPLALLWIALAYKQGLGTDFAFNVVRRSE